MGFTVFTTLRSTRHSWPLVSGQATTGLCLELSFIVGRSLMSSNTWGTDADPVIQMTPLCKSTRKSLLWAHIWVSNPGWERDRSGASGICSPGCVSVADSGANHWSSGESLSRHSWDSISNFWEDFIFIQSIFLVSKIVPLKKDEIFEAEREWRCLNFRISWKQFLKFILTFYKENFKTTKLQKHRE